MAVDVWHKNLDIIKQRYPAFFELVQRLATLNDTNRTGSSLIEIFMAQDGFLSLKAEGVLIHSSRSPEREAERLVKNALNGAVNNGAIIILGFGLGYTAEAAAKTMPDCPLVIVEKRPEIFITALKYRNLSALFDSGKHIFIIGGEEGGILAGLGVVRQIRVILRNPALLRLDHEWYAGLEEQIKLWQTKEAVNAATLRRFGTRWVRNLARNLEAIRDLPGVSLLAGKFAFPVLLLAAGPSLDELRPYLRELRERCMLIAVDTAQRFLRSEDIAADFVVTADPQYWNLRHLDRAGFTETTCLVADPSAQNAALRCAPRTFLCSSAFPLGRFIEDAVDYKGVLGAGGSVATSAFDFARLILGACKQPLFIAGLDLAFPQIKTHFLGAFFEEQSLIAQNRFIPAQTACFLALHNAAPYLVPDMEGGKVLTDKRLGLYAKWFENKLRLPAAAPVYSVSPRGMAIAGLKLAPVSDLLKLPPRRREIDDCKTAVFNAIYAEWNSKIQRGKRTVRFDNAKRQLTGALENIRKSPADINTSPAKNIVMFLVPQAGTAGTEESLRLYAESAAFHLKYITAL